MHCRESVWDEEFSYRIFGGILWVTVSRVFAQWVFGNLISNLCGLIFLDSEMSACCFLHSLQGVRKLTACCHHLDGMLL